MAGVDGETEEIAGERSFGRSEEACQKTVRCDDRRVGDGHFAAGLVVDGERREVLDKRAAAPYVERLQAKADGQNGLAGDSGVIEQQVVGGLTRDVGASGCGVAGLAVEGGVDVCGATGEENAVAGFGEG